jgi:hypothetical protein
MPLGMPEGRPEPPKPPLGRPLGQAVLFGWVPVLLDEEPEPQPASNSVEAASSATAAGTVRRRVLRTRVMGQ